MRSLSALALVTLAPALAVAAPKLPLSTTHNPPVILDEPSFYFELISDGASGYGFRTRVGLVGMGAKSDMVRVELRQQGKLLATAKCGINREDSWGDGMCEFREKPLTAKGPVEAQIIYWDDKEEKDYLVRTIKSKVYHWKGQWDTWGIVQDDLLGGAWMYMGNDETNDGSYRRPNMYMWFANGDYLGDSVFRCTVDGTKKLEDIELGTQGGSETGEIEADIQPKGGKRINYKFTKVKFAVEVYWGKRDTLKHDLPERVAKDMVLGDNPGKWDCFVRNKGKNIRQVKFTVNADGMIEQDEMQSGKGAIPTIGSRVVFVDNRLTKDSETFDQRINPAAIKAGYWYGMPWPEHPKVKDMHASLPKKSGFPDPK